MDYDQIPKGKNLDFFNKKILEYKSDFSIQKKTVEELSIKTSSYSIGSDLNPFYLKKTICNNLENGTSNVINKKKDKNETDGNLEKIFEIVSESFQLIQKDNYKLKKKKEILIEWKEVARRLDVILFIIATISITTTPILLFAKFYFRNEASQQYSKHQSCGCSNGF